MDDETSLITIFFLLLMSAFFSGSETALTASSQPLMHRLEQGGDKRAAVVNRLYDQKERLIGAIKDMSERMRPGPTLVAALKVRTDSLNLDRVRQDLSALQAENVNLSVEAASKK